MLAAIDRVPDLDLVAFWTAAEQRSSLDGMAHGRANADWDEGLLPGAGQRLILLVEEFNWWRIRGWHVGDRGEGVSAGTT